MYLGIDLGTQGAKAVVFDANTQKIVAQGTAIYDIIPSKHPGRAEQDTSTWIQGIKAAVQQAVKGMDVSQLKALAVSGQQHGLVVLDDAGKVLRPAKLWCDTESASEAKELSEKLGHILVPSFTATKVLWLQRHEPDVYVRVRHILLPHDYLNYYFTGRMVTECGDASGTGMFNSATRTWDTEVMDHIDSALKTMIPGLVGSDEIIGTLLPEVAAEFGLPAGLAVAPGSGDNAMSALGAGAVSNGQMVVSLGTSGTIFGKSDVPILDPSGTICPFCDATGAWLPLLCTLNCTKVLEEVRSCFGMDHAVLTDLAEHELPGCEGVTFLPYLVGERTPNWPHAFGALTGLRPGSLRPGLLYRAALEGATLSLLSGLRRMMALGLCPSELRLVGGGSRNKLWRQMVADAFQLPVRIPLEADSAALGAALQAAACHQGIPVAQFVQQHQPPVEPEAILPNHAHCQAYQDALARHELAGKQLFA